MCALYRNLVNSSKFHGVQLCRTLRTSREQSKSNVATCPFQDVTIVSLSSRDSKCCTPCLTSMLLKLGESVPSTFRKDSMIQKTSKLLLKINFVFWRPPMDSLSLLIRQVALHCPNRGETVCLMSVKTKSPRDLRKFARYRYCSKAIPRAGQLSCSLCTALSLDCPPLQLFDTELFQPTL